jgi:TDG/mug DNA glycosylase family protein
VSCQNSRPDQIGRQVGRDGKTVRAWLRRRWPAQRPGQGGEWALSHVQVQETLLHFSAPRPKRGDLESNAPIRTNTQASSMNPEQLSAPPANGEAPGIGHRITEDWMGQRVDTLADLLQPELRAVCVGINPAPSSVRVGHYYQGALGQGFFRRLRSAGLLPAGPGWEDDLAFENGIGFTDIVKRPTARATEIHPDEFKHGRPLLVAKLEPLRLRLVVFTFKDAAKKYFGPFEGNGLLTGRDIGGAKVFVMPGPYAPGDLVRQKIEELRALVN